MGSYGYVADRDVNSTINVTNRAFRLARARPPRRMIGYKNRAVLRAQRGGTISCALQGENRTSFGFWLK